MLNLRFLCFLIALCSFPISLAHGNELFNDKNSSFVFNENNTYSQGGGNNSDALLPAEKAFKFEHEVKGNKLFVRWAMPDGYYLYKDQISVSSDAQVRLPAPDFTQKHKNISDPIFGDVDVFYQFAEAYYEIDPFYKGDLDVAVSFQGCASGRLCYPPSTVDLTVPFSGDPAGLNTIETSGLYDESPVSGPTVDEVKSEIPETSNSFDSSEILSSSHILLVMAIFFAIGLGLTFTPCVLPMIPIISSIVVGQGDISTKRAFALSSTYVMGMTIVYTSLGMLAGSFGAEWNIQAAMQTPWVLVAFAAMFAGLSLAMFGIFELKMPSSVHNFIERKGKGGSFLGVFVIGALSALAVSPCVSAPLAGTLIYLSTTGDYFTSGAALLSLSLGMGVPLILAGTFGRKILPKSGEWMNAVKAVFGFILLGVSVWLLTRIFPEHLDLLLWGILGLGVSIFLFTLRATLPKMSGLLLLLCVVVATWSLFMVAGSAIGESESTMEQPLKGFVAGQMTSETKEEAKLFEIIETEDQLQSILMGGKPVLLDVYADWCISCLVMDKEIFSKASVRALQEDIRFVKFDMSDFTGEHKTFLNKHSLIGPPALIFYNSEGDIIKGSTLPGEIGLEKFESHYRYKVAPYITRN